MSPYPHTTREEKQRLLLNIHLFYALTYFLCHLGLCVSDKSRERLYLPEFELQVPGTKLKNKCPAFFLADRRAASGAPSGKGQVVGCKEVPWLSGLSLLVIIKQETSCFAPSHSFFLCWPDLSS